MIIDSNIYFSLLDPELASYHGFTVDPAGFDLNKLTLFMIRVDRSSDPARDGTIKASAQYGLTGEQEVKIDLQQLPVLYHCEFFVKWLAERTGAGKEYSDRLDLFTKTGKMAFREEEGTAIMAQCLYYDDGTSFFYYVISPGPLRETNKKCALQDQFLVMAVPVEIPVGDEIAQWKIGCYNLDTRQIVTDTSMFERAFGLQESYPLIVDDGPAHFWWRDIGANDWEHPCTESGFVDALQFGSCLGDAHIIKLNGKYVSRLMGGRTALWRDPNGVPRGTYKENYSGLYGSTYWLNPIGYVYTGGSDLVLEDNELDYFPLNLSEGLTTAIEDVECDAYPDEKTYIGTFNRKISSGVAALIAETGGSLSYTFAKHCYVHNDRPYLYYVTTEVGCDINTETDIVLPLWTCYGVPVQDEDHNEPLDAHLGKMLTQGHAHFHTGISSTPRGRIVPGVHTPCGKDHDSNDSCLIMNVVSSYSIKFPISNTVFQGSSEIEIHAYFGGNGGDWFYQGFDGGVCHSAQFINPPLPYMALSVLGSDRHIIKFVGVTGNFTGWCYYSGNIDFDQTYSKTEIELNPTIEQQPIEFTGVSAVERVLRESFIPDPENHFYVINSDYRKKYYRCPYQDEWVDWLRDYDDHPLLLELYTMLDPRHDFVPSMKIVTYNPAQ